jgi:xanthine dehydrogenase small subunit
MGSQQIRNVATLAGNIANASPIADGAVALLGLDASVHLVSKRGTREVRLEDFYLGYKKTVLQKDEIIQSIEIPLTQNKCFFEKSSKRYSVDIAAVSSFMNISINGNCVEKCRIAFGGVAEYPKLAKKCYEFLISKKLNEENFQTAAQIAETEFNTISDIRGSADYRRILIRNHILKHFNRLMGLE